MPPTVWALPCNSRCCAIPAWPWRRWMSRSTLLSNWLAAQLGIPAAAFAEYARRPQTMTDHARVLAATLGLRPPATPICRLMIEAAAQAAWSTDRGQPIVAGVDRCPACREDHSPGIGGDRAHRHCRPRPRPQACRGRPARWPSPPSRSPNSTSCSLVDPALGVTPFAWLKNAPTIAEGGPCAASCSIGCVRSATSACRPDAATRSHEDRFRQFVREGRISDAHQIEPLRRTPTACDPGRDSGHDLEARLTDAVLDMADKLIGGLFARAKNAKRDGATSPAPGTSAA